MYVLRILGNRRDAFIAHLKSRNVDTGIHYIPNHHHPYFAKYARGSLPVADQLGDEIVTLPLFSDISKADVDAVVAAVLDFDAAQ
jgi:dTDP-4-amino-4,6-dideoxygalactose transaminase